MPTVALVEIEALTEQERAILVFEDQLWLYRGSKEQAVKDAFDLSITRYEQWLLHIAELPSAQVEFPMLVNRLRRLRETRQQARSARRLSA